MNYYNFFKKTDLKTMRNFDFKICDKHCTLHHCENECPNVCEKSGSEPKTVVGYSKEVIFEVLGIFIVCYYPCVACFNGDQRPILSTRARRLKFDFNIGGAR
jgi:hypothetical protein